MCMLLRARLGKASPRISAYRVTSSSSWPRLPGGLVRLFQRAAISLARDGFSTDGMFHFTDRNLSILLAETPGVGAGKPLGQGGIHHHVSDDRRGHEARQDPRQRRFEARGEVRPRFAPRGRDPEPVLDLADGGAGPAILDLV